MMPRPPAAIQRCQRAFVRRHGVHLLPCSQTLELLFSSNHTLINSFSPYHLMEMKSSDYHQTSESHSPPTPNLKHSLRQTAPSQPPGDANHSNLLRQTKLNPKSSTIHSTGHNTSPSSFNIDIRLHAFNPLPSPPFYAPNTTKRSKLLHCKPPPLQLH